MTDMQTKKEEMVYIVENLVKLSKPSFVIHLVLTFGLLGPIGKIALLNFEGAKIELWLILLSIVCFLLIMINWVLFYRSWRSYNKSKLDLIEFRELVKEYKP